MKQDDFTLHAHVETKEVSLTLKHGLRIIECVVAGDGRSVFETLLPAVDTMLKKHNLQQEEITDFTIESSLPDGYSARRIAETIARVFAFSKKS